MAAKRKTKQIEKKKAPEKEPINYNKLCYDELVKLNNTLSKLIVDQPDPREQGVLHSFLKVFIR